MRTAGWLPLGTAKAIETPLPPKVRLPCPLLRKTNRNIGNRLRKVYLRLDRALWPKRHHTDGIGNLKQFLDLSS